MHLTKSQAAHDAKPPQKAGGFLVILEVTDGPHKGQRLIVDRHDTFLVGRAKEAHICLPDRDPYFSRWHFLLEVNPPNCRLVDLESHNGTLVNGTRVASIDLHDGDEICGGTTRLRISIRSASLTSLSLADVEDLVDHQRNAWEAGRQWRAYDYVDCRPDLADDPVQLLDLVLGEIELRRVADENPTAKEYIAKFPQLDGLIQIALLGQAPAAPTVAPAEESSADVAAMPAFAVKGYRIEAKLGGGGMGVVYRAVCESDGALVALKTISPRLRPSGDVLERFLREAEILKALEHPHIVRYRDFGRSEGTLYIAMEFVPGEDASSLVKREGPLEVKRATRLMQMLLQTLDFAHSRQFIHRDIKPANLLVYLAKNEERAKLTDFGLARAYQQSPMSGLTVSGVSAGTPMFMPPEQLLDFRSVTPAADQYSAAATYYFLLTGRTPHSASHLEGHFKKILKEDPVPIRTHRPELPAALEAAIQKALMREPQNRFANVREFNEAIATFGSELE